MSKDKDDSLNDKLKAMLGSMGSKINAGAAPIAFEGCPKVYRATYKEGELPLYIGFDTTEAKFLLAFGPEDPLILTTKELLYLVTALGGLSTTCLDEERGMGRPEIESEITNVMKDTTFSKGINASHKSGSKSSSPADLGKMSTDELKKLIFSDDEKSSEVNDKVMDGLTDLENGLEEIKNTMEQAEEYTKNMSEEERKEYLQKVHQQKEEELGKHMRDFERQLLGTLDEEDPTTYNYNYFKNVYKESGQAGLKEELAKIPKEERQEIIQKIMAEFKSTKQQDEKTN